MKIFLMGSGQGMGGLPVHFRKLAAFLHSEGHRLMILEVADKNAALPLGIEGLEWHGRVEENASSSAAKIRKGLGLWTAGRKAAAWNPDCFIAAALGKGYAVVGRKIGLRSFRVFQDVIANPPAGDPLRQDMLSAFDAVAVQSPSMRKPFEAAMGRAKPVGVLPCFSSSPAPGYLAGKPDGGKICLAYFGRLAGNKGLLPFLRVFAESQRGRDVIWDIHGGGTEKAALEAEISRLKIGAQVKLCGRYPEGDAYAALLSSYHGLVLPSTDSEGLPLVLLEAMSYGLPFLCTDIGAIPDCAANNPDVVMTGRRPEELKAGLHRFVEALAAGTFDSLRLQTLYREKFGEEAMKREWRAMLENPKNFFGWAGR